MHEKNVIIEMNKILIYILENFNHKKSIYLKRTKLVYVKLLHKFTKQWLLSNRAEKLVARNSCLMILKVGLLQRFYQLVAGKT